MTIMTHQQQEHTLDIELPSSSINNVMKDKHEKYTISNDDNDDDDVGSQQMTSNMEQNGGDAAIDHHHTSPTLSSTSTNSTLSSSSSLTTSASPSMSPLLLQKQHVQGKTGLFPRNQSLSFGLAGLPIDENPQNFLISNENSDEWIESTRRAIEESIIRGYQRQGVLQQQKQSIREEKPFSLADILPEIREGFEATVNDSFTACFEQKPPEAWNWNPFLSVLWCIGVFVRYCIVFPVRFLFYVTGMLVFTFIFTALFFMKDSPRKTRLFRRAIQLFAGVWIISLCGVIKYHDVPPVRRKNQIYVSNHTSLLDYVVLGHYSPFAAVGQKHGGFVGFMQTKVVGPLNNIFFERFEYRDRRLVTQRMKEHIGNTDNPPLLIFPEGVCVNNEYVVLFKKGVFDIEDVEICPVAIRYNKLFSDPYWSSKHESFLSHILRIMKSWCLVCDVYFLEPQKRQAGESSEKFAGRVQKMIAERAGLTVLDWDGYYKYFQVSERLIKERQKQIAMRLKRKFDLRAPPTETEAATTAAPTIAGGQSISIANDETKKDR